MNEIISKDQIALEEFVHEAHVAVGHVAAANYRERENEAHTHIDAAANKFAADLAALRQRIAELEGALGKIDRATAEWDANKLGDIQLQRKRWQRCGDIARAALER